MKVSAVTLLAALLSAPIHAAVTPRSNTEEKLRVISLGIARNKVSDPLRKHRLRRRADTIKATLDNEETLYFVNSTIGTPAQSLRLHLDTGSSDLWVNTPSSSLCQEKNAPCKPAGTYNSNSSSTYEYVGSWFNISYVDGSGAFGDYVKDTATIGGNTVSSLQFGIGYTSSSAQGILGIGYKVNEVQVGRAGKEAYDNYPAKLVADGKISSNAYSLWLNDLDANTGSILFGGVDTEQYTGTLSTLPIQAEAGTHSEFMITLTSLKMGSKTVANDQALAVLLDSGSSLTYLPDEIVQTIYNDLGASYDSSDGVAYVPCSMADSTSNDIQFTFSSPSISVSMGEMVLDLAASGGKRPVLQNGQDACLFGIAPAGSGTNVLGDTFLRSAYVVYDLDNNEISLAQTRFNATKNSVQEVSKSGPPGATKIQNTVTATSGIAASSKLDGFSFSGAGSTSALLSGVSLFLPVSIGSLLLLWS